MLYFEKACPAFALFPPPTYTVNTYLFSELQDKKGEE
jgi:hypothetical protein